MRLLRSYFDKQFYFWHHPTIINHYLGGLGTLSWHTVSEKPLQNSQLIHSLLRGIGRRQNNGTGEISKCQTCVHENKLIRGRKNM